MDNILEQIGITREELIERIVNKALGLATDYKSTAPESWEEVPFSEVVDRNIGKAIGNLIDTMTPLLQDRINDIINRETEKIFNSPFQRVDSWGKPIGDPISVRDMIKEITTKYWDTAVNDKGEPVSSYGQRVSRAEYYAGKVMREYYNKQLVGEVEKMAAELRDKIPETISSEISKSVLKYLKK